MSEGGIHQHDLPACAPRMQQVEGNLEAHAHARARTVVSQTGCAVPSDQVNSTCLLLMKRSIHSPQLCFQVCGMRNCLSLIRQVLARRWHWSTFQP